MDRDRLRRIRNFQSQDWFAAFFVRPLTIAIMLVVADWKVLTPNRLTTLANLCKLAAAALLLYPQYWIWTVVFLQLGCLLDHLDGTMARYRRSFTKVGSYYDKVSDMITWGLVVAALGWQVYRETGEASYLLLAVASAIPLNVCGYAKWLAVAETERVRWLEARADPAAVVAKRTAPIVIAPPPERTPRAWVRWFFHKLARVFVFDEIDLWFWLSLALVLDRLAWCVWLFFVTQVANMIVMVIKRGREMARADARIRELELEQPIAS